MNILGRDVLMGAYIDGVKQLRSMSTDGQGGYCVIGLLLREVGCPHLLDYNLTGPGVKEAHQACFSRCMARFEVDYDEWKQLQHENDILGYDFLTMAWAHCRPTTETAEQGDDQQ
jgi:hypothetical protein